MNNLKNIFKCLSVAAVAGMLSMGTVNAAGLSCKSDETVHTNYYMFLAENSKRAILENTSSKTWSLISAAKEYNIVEKGSTLVSGVIPVYDSITDPNVSTSEDLAAARKSLAEIGLKPWSIEEFVRNFYDAYNSTNYILAKGNDAYVVHNRWVKCNGTTDPNACLTSAGAESIVDDYKNLIAAMKKELDNSSNLNPTQSLYSNGFAYPITDAHFIDNPSTTSNNRHYISISREVKASDVAKINGVSTGKVYAGDTETNDLVFFPAVGYIQYCSAKEGVPPVVLDPDETYTVKYDANGGKDAPADQTSKIGACVEISKIVPKYSGQEFLGWSTDPKAVEPDKNYKAGEKYCEDKNITLYAVWNTKTGVSAHVVAFGALALVAAGALIVAKKKNLFKQI